MAKTREQLRTESAAKRLQKRNAFIALRNFVTSVDALKLMTLDDIITAIGVLSAGLSGTFLLNMQRRLIEKMQKAELKSVANWIQSLILSQYPDAEVITQRSRVVQVYLDGVPKVEEIE